MKADYLLKSRLFCLAERVWATWNFLRPSVNVIARGSVKGNHLPGLTAALAFVQKSQRSSEVQAAPPPSSRNLFWKKKSLMLSREKWMVRIYASQIERRFTSDFLGETDSPGKKEKIFRSRTFGQEPEDCHKKAMPSPAPPPRLRIPEKCQVKQVHSSTRWQRTAGRKGVRHGEGRARRLGVSEEAHRLSL